MRQEDAARRRPPGTFKEALLATLIILAVALSLLAEGLVVAGASWDARRPVSWGLAALDLLFTALAAADLARSLNEGSFRGYLRERAWIDLPSSIIPLVFTTGPFLFESSFGVHATTTLVALGNFRLLRGLGLLRALRLFHFYRRSESERTAALALVATLSVFIVAEAASIAGFWPDSHEALSARRETTLAALSARQGGDNAESIARVDGDLLLVRNSGLVVYTRYSSEEYLRRFAPDEIGYLRAPGGIEAFFSLKGELKAEAASALVSSLSALSMLAALSLGLSGRGRRHGRTGPDAVGGDGSPARRGASAAAAGAAVPLPGQDAPAGPEEIAALLDDGGYGP